MAQKGRAMQRLRFRSPSRASAAPAGPGDDRRLPGRVARLSRAVVGYGRATVLLAGIWLLCLVAFGAVFQFERTVHEAGRAQVVIAEMSNQQATLILLAFDPAIRRRGRQSDRPRRQEFAFAWRRGA